MRDQFTSSSIPPGLQRFALRLRLGGLIAFWVQLVLAVVSTVILLVYVVFSNNPGRAGGTGTGLGIFFAICGLVTLGVGTYWAFRYVRMAKALLEPNNSRRPSKAETIQALQTGVAINLAGMLLTLVGAQAIIGSTLGRSLSQQPGLIVRGAIQIIEPIDLFVVQANTNTIFAHFAGLVAALWLLSRINKG
jgi:hypothetical protein